MKDRTTEIAVEKATRAHDGFRKVDVIRFHQTRVDDAAAQTSVIREILRSPPVIAVLPFDPQTYRMVLLRQFRLGGHLATGSGMMIEIVAGGVDEGETPEAAARRELAEETTLEARTLRPIARFLSSPGISDEYITLFLAEVDASALPERAGHDLHEVIYPFSCRPDEAIAAADAGGIANVFTLLALNWFARHEGDLYPARGGDDR